MDQLAEAIEERGIARRHRHFGQSVFQPKQRQFLRGMRQYVDADADRLDLGHRFEHAAGDAARMQGQRERQPADTAADDADILFSGRHDVYFGAAARLIFSCASTSATTSSTEAECLPFFAAIVCTRRSTRSM